MDFKLINGDNMEKLKMVPDNSIDSVVTDPPYGINFMGKKWDYDVPTKEFWQEIYRVLKPGGHILSFCGTRTYHRMVVNIEDAGFEIRDQIDWVYGSGFPKSHNIGKAVDKLEGNEREVGPSKGTYISKGGQLLGENSRTERFDSKGTSEYEGWGTALKPAHENICLARKPLSEKSVVENVLKWKTGGINIGGCKIGSDIIYNPGNKNKKIGDNNIYGKFNSYKEHISEGRFPANIIFDEEAGKILDEQSGISKTRKDINYKYNNTECKGNTFSKRGNYTPREDEGGASRFFYCPKVSNKERNLGCENKSSHPTVKPIKLLTYLCRLITPKNGIVLDPFMGSGSTGIAALLEGFKFCGIEMDKDYFKICEARINSWEKYKEL